MKDPNVPLHAHVELNEVEEVIFMSCDFKNTTILTEYFGMDRGTGIKAFDSYFRVSYKCTNPIFGGICPEADRVGCNFEGMYNGIYAGSVSFNCSTYINFWWILNMHVNMV